MTASVNSPSVTIRHAPPLDGTPAALRGGSHSPDVLTAFLEPCRFRCDVVAPTWLRAPWGLEFPKGIPAFLLVLEGACILEPPEVDRELSLRGGDFVVLPRDAGFVVRDREDSPVSPVEQWHDQMARNDRQRSAAAPEKSATRLAWGRLALDDDYSRQAFALLPSVALLSRSAPEAERAAPLVRVLLDEMSERRPGGELLTRHLVQILLVHALRALPGDLPAADSGLISALRVPGLGLTLGAIHSQPERDWSVRELAGIAGLSRAAFAARFAEALGRPPFEYLRDVRMHRACQLLRETEKGVKEIAARVGYATEASFSKAFTRWCATAPGEYRRQSRSAG